MAKRRILPTTFLVIAALVAVFPIVFTIASSFMSGAEIADRYTAEITETNSGDFISSGIHFVRFGLIPEQPTLDQYKELLLDSPDYLRMFWNSVLLVVPVLIGQCILAPLAAFGIENLRWRFKEAIYFAYIIVMLMPTQILLVPNFIVAGWLGIRENYLAIILPAMFHPLGVFLVRQQLKNFPKECLEAVRELKALGVGVCFEEQGIDTTGLVSDPDAFTTLAFVALSPDGEREFSFARKPGADTQLTFDELDLSLIDETRVFHFGTLSLTGEPARTTTYRAVEYAKAHGKLVTYDPNYRPPLWKTEQEAKEQILALKQASEQEEKKRKGELQSMEPVGSRMKMTFVIPERGLFGYKSEFLTDTKGEGVMNTLFHGYAPYKGDIPRRQNGSLIAFETGETITYGLYNAQERGTLFLGAGEPVYAGQVVGMSPKNEDIAVNVCKKKQLTNTRASGSDDSLRLIPPRRFSLEESLEFLSDDELLEVTPKSIRMRKMILSKELRMKQASKKK